jgi:hypothetical protein
MYEGQHASDPDRSGCLPGAVLVGPIGNQLAVSEAPRTVLADERIQIANGYDQQHALTVLRPNVVGETVGLAARLVTVEPDGALSVEVGRDLVVVEDLERLGELGVALQALHRLCGSRITCVDAHRTVGRE